jgi:hypothetical protein
MELYEQRIQGITKVEALFAAFQDCAESYRKQHFELLKHRQLSVWEIKTENELNEIQVHLQNLSLYVRGIEQEKKANQ